MVLRNYYIWKVFAWNNWPYGSGTYNVGATNIDGDSISYTQNSTNYITIRLRNTVLWTGLKPYVATKTIIAPDDYSIENSITSYFTNYQYSTDVNIDDGCVKYVCSISGQNATNQTHIIDQLLITKEYYYADSRGWQQSNECLFVKQDLDNPITVPPTVGFSLVFEWTEA